MTVTNQVPAARPVFGSVTPIFRVQSLPISIDYYVKVLGFKTDFHEPGIIASVSRDRCNIFLIEGDQGNPGTWIWIGVREVDALHQEYQSKGARIRQPTNQLFMGVRDADRRPGRKHIADGFGPQRESAIWSMVGYARAKLGDDAWWRLDAC